MRSCLVIGIITAFTLLSCGKPKQPNVSVSSAVEENSQSDTISRTSNNELPSSNGVSEIDGLSFYTEYPVYHTTTTRINAILSNRSQQVVEFGAHYRIAHEEDGQWKVLPLDYAFVDVGYIMRPNEDHSFAIDLSPDFLGNAPGRYRVYTDVTLRKAITMIAEFRLSADWDECKNAILRETPALLENVPPNPYDMPQQVDEDGNRIYTVTEIMPEFPGGQQNMIRYLEEQTAPLAKEYKGRVVVSFIVGKDGTIRQPEILRGVANDTLNNEALRIVKSMPKFNPGKQKGEAVVVRYTIPVTFR